MHNSFMLQFKAHKKIINVVYFLNKIIFISQQPDYHKLKLQSKFYYNC